MPASSAFFFRSEADCASEVTGATGEARAKTPSRSKTRPGQFAVVTRGFVVSSIPGGGESGRVFRGVIFSTTTPKCPSIGTTRPRPCQPDRQNFGRPRHCPSVLDNQGLGD